MRSSTFLISACAAIASFMVLTPANAQLRGYEIVVDETALDATVQKQLIVKCPGKKRAMGSGWAVLDKTNAILEGVATSNQPAFDGSSWLVNARNNSSFAKEWKLKVWVTCANVRALGRK